MNQPLEKYTYKQQLVPGTSNAGLVGENKMQNRLVFMCFTVLPVCELHMYMCFGADLVPSSLSLPCIAAIALVT